VGGETKNRRGTKKQERGREQKTKKRREGTSSNTSFCCDFGLGDSDDNGGK
jgi:hypothetical protein